MWEFALSYNNHVGIPTEKEWKKDGENLHSQDDPGGHHPEYPGSARLERPLGKGGEKWSKGWKALSPAVHR